MLTSRDYETLYNHTEDHICVLDRQGRLLDANPSWHRMVGVQDLTETQVTYLSYIREEDHPKAIRALERLLAGESIHRLILRCNNAEGETRWISVNAFMDPDGTKIFSTCRDVTHDQTFKEILERSRRQFMALVDSIDDAFFAVDSKGQFSYVNDHAEALLSATRDQVLGQPVQKFFQEDLSPKFSGRLIRAIREKRSENFTLYHPPVDLWLNCSIYSYAEGHTVYLRDVSDAIEKERELEKMASRDHLTNIYNRRTGLSFLEELMVQADRSRHPLAVLYVDINNLKVTNDRLGHRVGDQLIVDTCAIISEQLRATDVFCRVGGDEFLVVLPETDGPGAETFKNRTLAALDERNSRYREMDEPLRLSISVGIALYDHKTTVEQLIDRADQAMYEDKRRRKPIRPFLTTDD